MAARMYRMRWLVEHWGNDILLPKVYCSQNIDCNFEIISYHTGASKGNFKIYSYAWNKTIAVIVSNGNNLIKAADKVKCMISAKIFLKIHFATSDLTPSDGTSNTSDKTTKTGKRSRGPRTDADKEKQRQHLDSIMQRLLSQQRPTKQCKIGSLDGGDDNDEKNAGPAVC